MCVVIRDETFNEVNRSINPIRIQNREYVNKVKMDFGKCDICKLMVTESTTHLFDFDHLDQSTKCTEVSAIMHFNINKLKEEIAKCRLLCCKCHRLYSIQQQYENLEKIKNSK